MSGIDLQTWFIGAVLGAAKAVYDLNHPEIKGKVISSKSGKKYPYAHSLGKTNRFNQYFCILPNDQIGILKIAADRKFNDALEREALILNLLQRQAEELDDGRTKKEAFNYAYFFPQLIESFISPEQKNRRINIVGFPPAVETIKQLESLSGIISKEWVDPMTAAWMTGKSLKILSFSHNFGIVNNLIEGSNFLMEKGLHGVILYDWTMGEICLNNKVPREVAAQEIAKVARLAIEVLNGDLSNGKLPPSDQLPNNQLEQYIWRLAQGIEDNAERACEKFYQIIRGLWNRQFHEYTSFAREPKGE